MVHDLVEPLLNEKQLAAWLGVSLPNLQRRRSDGSGPPFVQLSERRIAYRKSAVERWLEARTINRVGALIAPPASRREHQGSVVIAPGATGLALTEGNGEAQNWQTEWEGEGSHRQRKRHRAPIFGAGTTDVTATVT